MHLKPTRFFHANQPPMPHSYEMEDLCFDDMQYRWSPSNTPYRSMSRRYKSVSRSGPSMRVRSRTPCRRQTIRGKLMSKERSVYRHYFNYIERSPPEELATVRGLIVPIIKTTPVTLPFNLGQTVADNCLSLSGMGYHLGLGGYCPTCTASGEPRLCRTDRAALILAYVQQLNNIYEYRVFLASILALSDRANMQAASAEPLLSSVLAQPELFFMYHIMREGGMRDIRVLFYRDGDAGGFMMYVIFPGKSVHLHYRLIDHIQAACRGYKIVAHVWQTTFLLSVCRNPEQQTETVVPSIGTSDVYCKMCDLNFDGELLLEYKRLYALFDDFVPPR
uniref:ORF27 n=1 Tax=Human herpesvirus 3 TaxID=10335 RepID=A0A4D6F610_HHV3|nr:ORF27 [Human alphaherpesvirus 3]